MDWEKSSELCAPAPEQRFLSRLNKISAWGVAADATGEAHWPYPRCRRGGCGRDDRLGRPQDGARLPPSQRLDRLGRILGTPEVLARLRTRKTPCPHLGYGRKSPQPRNGHPRLIAKSMCVYRARQKWWMARREEGGEQAPQPTNNAARRDFCPVPPNHREHREPNDDILDPIDRRKDFWQSV
jgi:hypothetical protein